MTSSTVFATSPPVLLADEGIGSHELGYFYNILMDHVRDRLLRGQSAGVADPQDLRHALNQRHRLITTLQGSGRGW